MLPTLKPNKNARNVAILVYTVSGGNAILDIIVVGTCIRRMCLSLRVVVCRLDLDDFYTSISRWCKCRVRAFFRKCRHGLCFQEFTYGHKTQHTHTHTTKATTAHVHGLSNLLASQIKKIVHYSIVQVLA
jgi:hypothetical protein